MALRARLAALLSSLKLSLRALPLTTFTSTLPSLTTHTLELTNCIIKFYWPGTGRTGHTAAVWSRFRRTGTLGSPPWRSRRSTARRHRSAVPSLRGDSYTDRSSGHTCGSGSPLGHSCKTDNPTIPQTQEYTLCSSTDRTSGHKCGYL